MRKKTSYIQDLGFDSIWMSPFTAQGMDAFGTSAYHGYWPSNFYEVNPAFGTKEELQGLVKFFQEQGLLLLPAAAAAVAC
jgi:alpha-amylase